MWLLVPFGPKLIIGFNHVHLKWGKVLYFLELAGFFLWCFIFFFFFLLQKMICLMWTTILVWDRVRKSCILVWNRTDLPDRERKMLGDNVNFSGGHIMWQKGLLIYVADYVISSVMISHRKLKVIGFATKSEHLKRFCLMFQR